MKKLNTVAHMASYSLLVACLAVGASGAFAASHSGGGASMSDIAEELSDLGSAIKGYSVEKRDEAGRKIEAGLAAADRKIEALEADLAARWETMDAAARREAREQMASLRQQRNAVAEWYGGMKHGSAAAWDEVKEGFVGAYGELRRSWSNAREKFGAARGK